MSHPVFIVNPRAGGQRYAERWQPCERWLAQRWRRYEVVRTTEPGQATALARRALDRGSRFIVSAGGDGTHAEVAQAFFVGLDGAGAPRPRHPDAVLGLLPLGTGNDLVRNLGLPLRVRDAFDALEAAPVAVDVGWVELLGAGGHRVRRLVLNGGSVGLSAATIARTDALPRWLGGLGVYLVAGVSSLATAARVPLSVAVDDGAPRALAPLLLAVSNGPCFGGGMRVSPLARPDDGRLEVLAIERSPLASLRLVGAFPAGRHLGRPGVSAWHGSCVELASETPAVAVEVDGELAGALPARFGVLPSALRVAGASLPVASA